jgi:hypothetical protein
VNPSASNDLGAAIRAVIEAKRAEVAAWEWLADVHVDVRREVDAGRGMPHALLVNYWNATSAVQSTRGTSDAASDVFIRATFDYRKAVSAAATWTADERIEWEESIAKLDGITVVDVDDWCQSKDKPTPDRAGVEGRARMLAYFTSPAGASSVKAYIAGRK